METYDHPLIVRFLFLPILIPLSWAQLSSAPMYQHIVLQNDSRVLIQVDKKRIS